MVSKMVGSRSRTSLNFSLLPCSAPVPCTTTPDKEATSRFALFMRVCLDPPYISLGSVTRL
eukprot:5305785-Heterocapsa_arctica.AAC.1